MGYSKTLWDEQTAITPARLNKIENALEKHAEDINELNTKVGNVGDNFGDEIRMKDTGLKVELREDDLDPSDPNNQGRIYFRTDL